jgi:hypothetical protein
VTRRREPLAAAQAEAAAPRMNVEGELTREALMVRHAAARLRRDSAPLGSDDYRAAAEEIARIEIAIAALVEQRPVPG